jgi:hypothetical protein
MEMLQRLLLGAACFGLAVEVHAAAVMGDGKAVIDALGVDGRWAVTCRQPASADNPYLVFETFREGPAIQRRIAPPDEPREMQLLDVEWKKKTRELVWVIPEGEVMLTVTSQLDGNRMRVMSIVTSDGVKLVSDARGDDGKPTPWLSKCETN